MIRFAEVALRRGGVPLVENASFQLHAGWKVGLTGANGTGKSSLLAALQGELAVDDGQIDLPENWVLAHLPQEVSASERRAVEYVLDGDGHLRHLQQQLQASAHDGQEQGRLYAEIDAIDGWTAEPRARQLLAGLGFSDQDAERPVSAFSGGWRMRLGLARTLMTRSEVLLLDEPTNHLDFETVLWLEDWLLRYPGTLLLIAHDRRFLDAVVDHTLHIEHRRVHLFSGGYSAAERQRLEQMAQNEAMARRISEERGRLEQFVTRFRAKASKARQAQSRLRRLEKIQDVEIMRAARRIHLELPTPSRLPDPLLVLEKAEVWSGESCRLRPATLSLRPDDRIGILGPNGAGKSTLLAVIAGILPVSSGLRQVDPDLPIGYFAQHQREQLDDNASPLLHLQRLGLSDSEQMLRNRLGALGFTGERADRPVAGFSGGERVRLVLAMLISRAPALVLLDEPTNHLDLEMRETLSAALESYAGALVMVSHDRELLDRVCDQFWRVENGVIEVFPGDLADYTQQVLARGGASRSAPASGAGNGKPLQDSSVSQRDRRRLAAEQRQARQPLQRRAQELERACVRIQSELQTLEAALADPERYSGDHTQWLQEQIHRQSRLRSELAQQEEAWLEALDALEQAIAADTLTDTQGN